MSNLMSFWMALDLRRRVVAMLAVIAIGTFLALLASMIAQPRLELLYAGLDPAAAGEVVAALEQRGAVHEVRGESIFVDSRQRDGLRMALAAEGLPQAGVQGYELLDGLSGFGTTAQMFDAAYWRAKEGELARTLLALPTVKAARVHISPDAPSPFRTTDKRTASVTVTTAGGSLTADQARAIQHLVAAAVTGLMPADVAVIDGRGGLIEASESNSALGTSLSDREAELRGNVERLLAARVGPGNAVVEVSVDLVTETEQITERRFDPAGRVAISTDSEERTESSSDSEGQVSVASNLPEGDAGADNSGRSDSSQTRERVNFEVSETQRELLRGPGSIRRLGVAVLVNGVPSTAEDGTLTLVPRPPEELADLRELVAAAVGIDEARGDTLTVKSLAFEVAPSSGSLSEPGLLQRLDPMQGVQILALLVAIALIALFVLRPILLARAGGPAGPPLAQLPAAQGASRSPRVLTGEIDDRLDVTELQIVSPGETDTALPTDPVSRLRRLIEERQAESIEILRGWMEDREEKA